MRLQGKKKDLVDKTWQKVFKEQTQKKKAKKLVEIRIGILAGGVDIIKQVHEAVKMQKKEERAKNVEKPSVRVARLLNSIKRSDKLETLRDEQKGSVIGIIPAPQFPFMLCLCSYTTLTTLHSTHCS